MNDLDAIYDYTKARWSSRQAKTYLRRIETRIEDAAADRIMALPGGDIALSDPLLFKVKAGRHIVFFLRDDKTIFVVRILHERMDLARHLE